MSENKRRPTYNLIAKNKDTRATTRVGAAWENDYEGFNVTFEKETNQWGTTLIDLLGLSSAQAGRLDSFWFSLAVTKKKEGADEAFPR